MILWAWGWGVTDDRTKIAFWSNEDILKPDSIDEYPALWETQHLRWQKC